MCTQLSPRLFRPKRYFGAFRRSELANLKWEDLEEDERGFTVTLKSSKTDQEGKGIIKILPYRSEIHFCPVRCIKRLEAISTSEYLFQGMSKSGKVINGQASVKAIERVIKKYLGNDHSAHSLRAGFITETAINRSKLNEIAKQTGHKHLSTLMEYIRPIDAWEGNAAHNA